MSRKSQLAYEDVLQSISDKIFDLNTAQSFTSDYELAMRNAIIKLFPHAKMYACYFHYTQAVKRRASQLREVMIEIQNDELARSIYQRCQCLPLLTAQHILDAFRDLVSESSKLQDRSAFRPFLMYMREQWLKKVRFVVN